jgi:hypothetical protein
MKKIEKLNAQLADLEKQIKTISFERRDTSFRRSGGYFGTNNALTNDVIVVDTIARTKHLNTYVCVNIIHADLIDKYNNLKGEISSEYERINKKARNKWAKDSINSAKDAAERDIKDGTVLTNYAKMFIVGHRHIYYAHPLYGHGDYNKSALMPNTPKHRKVADELNQLLIANGLSVPN